MRPPDSGPFTLTRRGFVLAGAGALLTSGCGGDDDTGGSNGDTASGRSFATFFDPMAVVAGQPLRLPIGLVDHDGVVVSDAPATLPVRVRGNGMDERLEIPRHDRDVPRPYYPLRVTFAEAGMYTMTATTQQGDAETSLEVAEAGSVRIPKVGEPLPPFATPTTDDKRGVATICTREPACPLHDVTLDEALGGGKPIAFLISTPKFCQVRFCGPVLDILLDQQRQVGEDVHMLHAEVYADDSAKKLAPVVSAYRLSYEPVLFLADASGTITARLDNIYDTVELTSELKKLSGSG